MTRSERPPLDIRASEFRALGHALVDKIAEFLESLPTRRVQPADTPESLRALIGTAGLPDRGAPAAELLDEAARLLFEHSTFNGHPRFWGYITSSAAPIGALADLLASSVNPNVGSWSLAPAGTEIELQTIRWIAELIGYPTTCSGVLVSGGNMANFVCFLAARRAILGPDLRQHGLPPSVRLYTSAETHTWIQKAADLFGFGLDCVRFIPIDREQRMDVRALRDAIAADRRVGLVPFMVIGTAGSVSTGAVDPLPEIAAICKAERMWFHVDGAYGGLAAALPTASSDLRGLSAADSVAVDPHKWLYVPIEAGCALVRNVEALADAFSWHPTYYHFRDAQGEAPPVNFYELGPQNSRGLRALKVWLALRQAGRDGYRQMIADDCALAAELAEHVKATPELELGTNALSITTFRYAPPALRRDPAAAEYLDRLNTETLTRIQRTGEAYLSNAVVDGRFMLRACIVNFRTTSADVAALPALAVRCAREVETEMAGGTESNGVTPAVSERVS